ncbi:MAG TPA: hypothetical protein VGO39_05940 [Gaiellaceae bacterium]|nr:hypothetical protein [Gaiellaceae bacterium]
MNGRHRFTALVAAAAALTVALATMAGAGTASAPPVGQLPGGPTTTITTQVGQLVAFALPHRANGRVWRVARTIDSAVLVQVSEADVGANVVLVFKTTGKGSAKVSFALTRGETARAYEARRFTVNVQ